MKSEKLNLILALKLSAPFSREIIKDPCAHKKIVGRLQEALDDIQEEDSYFHRETKRLQKLQEDFLAGKYLY